MKIFDKPVTPVPDGLLDISSRRCRYAAVFQSFAVQAVRKISLDSKRTFSYTRPKRRLSFIIDQ